MSSAAPVSQSDPHTAQVRRKVAAASAIGNFVEWFDSGAYAVMSATISGLFFPQYDPAAALLSTWAIFAGGFIARPLGAAFFGRYGDRIGRKRMLAASVLCMSTATFLVGLLPPYSVLGIAAPMLLFLLRAVQGFSTGGEYTGGAAFIMEHAPEGKRAQYASPIPVTVGVAAVAGSLVGVLLTSNLSADALQLWGWRIPFLLAGPLGLIGIYIRSRVDDTPVFQEMQHRNAVQKAPLREAIRVCGKQIAILFGYSITNAVAYYLMSSYMISYMSANLGYSKSQSLLTNVVAMLVYTISCVVMARGSDRFGRKPMLLLACGGFIVCTYPAFLLMPLGLAGAMAGSSIMAVFVGAIGTSNVPAMIELFPSTMRSSGSAIGYTAAYVLFGGTAPFVASGLATATGTALAPGYCVIGVAMISAVVVLFAFRETKDLPLTRTTVRSEPANTVPSPDPSTSEPATFE